MTYCLAIQLDEGLVFCSDSRTNAGADRVSTYSKMHRFSVDGERSLYLMTSGNLATSQAVVAHIQRDLQEDAEFNIRKAKYVAEVADYVGEVSSQAQAKYKKVGGPDAEAFDASATLIYPEGNHITASEQHPYLQIGETKYGKPILDRIISHDTSADTAMRCAILSLDSTMRSNATVGPPLECLFYRNDSIKAYERYCKLEENHPYLIEIRQDWDRSIREAVERLPSLSAAFEDTP